MKRSEMVDLIWKRLAPVGVGSETCEEILFIVEEAGMLPPEATVEKIINCGDGQKVETIAGNIWEDE